MADNESRTRIILEPDQAAAAATQRTIKEVDGSIEGFYDRVNELAAAQYEAAAAAQDQQIAEYKLAQAAKAAQAEIEREKESLDGLNESVDAAGRRRDEKGRFLPGGGGGAGLKKTKEELDDVVQAEQKAYAGATTLQRALGKLSRGEQINAIGQEMGALAKKTGDVTTSAAQLEKKLLAVGATDDEIGSAANAFNTAANASDPDAGRNRLQSLGANIRNLPSIQIPGLGIGTDALGNLLRVSGALQESLKGQATATAATTATSTAATAAEGGQSAANTTLATTSGAAAIGVGTIIAATGAFAVIGLAAAAAISALNADAERNTKINAELAAQYKASDKVFQEILNGLTTLEARTNLEREQKELNEANKELEQIKAENARVSAQIRKDNPFLGIGTLVDQIKFSRGEEGYGERTKREAQLNEQVLENTANIERYTEALEGNELAANDAAEAEKKRKEEVERTQKELESLQKRGAEADKKFAQKQEDDARGYDQKLSDIETSLQDKRADIQQKFADDRAKEATKERRDERDAATKIRREEQDARIKDQQDALEAAVKNQRALEKIRDDGLRSEEDQLRQRNFLGATLASENVQRQLEEADQAAKQEAQDRAIHREFEAAERALDQARESEDRRTHNADARADLNTAFKQQNRDAQLAYDKQLRDAETQYDRLQETTQINYDREKTELQKQMDELLGIRVAEVEKEKALAAGASPEAVLRSASSSTTNNSSATSINDYRSMNFNGSASASTLEAFRRISLETMRATRYA